MFSLPHKRSLHFNNLNNENKILPYSYYPFPHLHFTSNISEIHDHACSLHFLIRRASTLSECWGWFHSWSSWLAANSNGHLPVLNCTCSLCTIIDFPLLEILCSAVYIMPLGSGFLTTYHSFMTAVRFFFFFRQTLKNLNCWAKRKSLLIHFIKMLSNMVNKILIPTSRLWGCTGSDTTEAT